METNIRLLFTDQVLDQVTYSKLRKVLNNKVPQSVKLALKECNDYLDRIKNLKDRNEFGCYTLEELVVLENNVTIVFKAIDTLSSYISQREYERLKVVNNIEKMLNKKKVTITEIQVL